jgi:DNA replication ATP-dependent helicase Dna2
LAINRLLDVEEDIWSPRYGLKGKIDASIQATISIIPPKNVRTLVAKAGPKITNSPKPLEIKTGRNVAGMEHRAQTMLYSLIMAERYGIEIDESCSSDGPNLSGLLYYTQTEEVVEVTLGRNELRSLICKRNEMVALGVRRYDKAQRLQVEDANDGSIVDIEELSHSFLPPTIDDERACKRCYVVDTCMLYRKVNFRRVLPILLLMSFLRRLKMFRTAVHQSRTSTTQKWDTSPPPRPPSSRNGKT